MGLYFLLIHPSVVIFCEVHTTASIFSASASIRSHFYTYIIATSRLRVGIVLSGNSLLCQSVSVRGQTHRHGIIRPWNSTFSASWQSGHTSGGGIEGEGIGVRVDGSHLG